VRWDPPREDELRAWNEGVARSIDHYHRWPFSTRNYGRDKGPPPPPRLGADAARAALAEALEALERLTAENRRLRATLLAAERELAEALGGQEDQRQRSTA
jgi:hypothetical protein